MFVYKSVPGNDKEVGQPRDLSLYRSAPKIHCRLPRKITLVRKACDAGKAPNFTLGEYNQCLQILLRKSPRFDLDTGMPSIRRDYDMSAGR